jgi:hypothetical protein
MHLADAFIQSDLQCIYRDNHPNPHHLHYILEEWSSIPPSYRDLENQFQGSFKLFNTLLTHDVVFSFHKLPAFWLQYFKQHQSYKKYSLQYTESS